MGMVGALWAQSGIRPYQDLIDVDPGSRGFNTYANVVNGNLMCHSGKPAKSKKSLRRRFFGGGRQV